jgi:hypothetical protein
VRPTSGEEESSPWIWLMVSSVVGGSLVPLLRGVGGVAAWKSALLLSVSMLPRSRIADVLLFSVGAAPAPSKKLAPPVPVP